MLIANLNAVLFVVLILAQIWDIRTYKKIHSYFTTSPASLNALDFSQRGLLAVGFGTHVQVFFRTYVLACVFYFDHNLSLLTTPS